MSVLGILASLVIVVTSTAVYTGMLWWADRFEKEPKRLFTLALFWGAVPAAFLSVMGEVWAGIPTVTLEQTILASGVAGPIIEEVSKGLMLVFLFWLGFMEFDGVLDGLIYGALVGFGFAMTENFLYFLASLSEGMWGLIVFLRQFVFGLNHAFYTAFTGIGFGLMRIRRGRQGLLFGLIGWGLAIFFHSLHNTTLSLVQVNAMAFLLTLLFDAGGILVVIAVLVAAIFREQHILHEELADEVGHTLSAEDYERVRRIQLPLIGVSREERKRLRQVRQLAAELALKKHQLRQDEENRDLRLRVAQLRAALLTLKPGAPTTETSHREEKEEGRHDA